MANDENLKPFKKGYDPRRNLKGVPKDYIEARKFVRKIGAELLTIKERQSSGTIDEYEVTRIEKMVREKFSSLLPKDFEMLMKILYPELLRDNVDVTSGGNALTIKIIKASDDTDHSD